MSFLRMKKKIWIFIIFLVVISTFILVNDHFLTQTKGVIKIGFIAPLSGDAVSYGELMKNSVALAVEEINLSGGIKGNQIEMIYEDGKCNGKDAATAAHKLVNVDKVKYIAGAMCSGEAFGAIPITSPAKVFFISFAAGSAKLSGKSDYFVRNNPSDSLTGSILANYLAKQHKTSAIISEQTEYSQDIKDVFTSEADRENLKIVASEDYISQSTDFRSQLLKIKNQNPDVIFINPQNGKDVTLIAKQARQLGITSKFASTLLCSDPIVYTAGSITEDMVCVNLANLSTDKGKEFIKKYTETYGTTPNFQLYAGAAYDDIYLIRQAITSVGNDSTKVMKYLRSLPSYTGVIGTYNFDSKGDMVGAGLVLQKVVNKELMNI
jgi:branched-chain amino acid transport system substrate-binding protein